MRSPTAILALAALAFPLVARAASYGDELRIERGKELAKQWCASCHTAPPQASDAAPSFAAVAQQHPPGQIRAFLAKPHGTMPPLELSNEQIDDIVLYIETLK